MNEPLTTDQLQAACDMINDFISGNVDVKAIPSDGAIAWVRVYPQGEYPFARNEAFQRLVQAKYNPQKLLDFATNSAKNNDAD